MTRTTMTRTSMNPAQPKAKKCKACPSQFVPMKPMAVVCSPACALSLAKTKREKTEKTDLKLARKADKERRERLKTRGKWQAEAQAAFNRYIRARDQGKPCICCGRHGNGQVHGGEWDAGHYRSRGSAPHLRFDERNAHAQLKQCNRFASGNVQGYRLGLIARFGVEFVEGIEADQTPRHYSIDDLIQIKKTYAAKTIELKKRTTP